ncbi:DUF5067 domain-containing protein [Gordonibacter sp. An230]|uniref:DUF5067 domain-containing protein n=1 Tax=Gordonibacter sp. An230 TaxID=1965592 RepID=UPI000B38C574|nr:DUF5067 domain-containing protein [Gordonibacter sp. An230]
MIVAIGACCATLVVVAVGVLVCVQSGVFAGPEQQGFDPVATQPSGQEEETGDAPSSSADQAEKSEEEGEGDVIVAGSVDTSSKYSLEVPMALVGAESYSDVPKVILVCEFANNSDEPMSFGSALSSMAMQGGHELKTSYLQGASSYNYERIEPGQTMPVFLVWELNDAESDISITMVDQNHYAKEVVFEQTYTVEELVANSVQFVEEYGYLIEGGQDAVAV